MIRLQSFGKTNNIYAKLEYYNPFGSIKDRAALKIIEDAENRRYIFEGSTILEATSGNMGIALAAICKIKGYNCKIIMPDNMSDQRKALIKNYGAELILTPSNLGMVASIEKAQNLSCSSDRIYYTDQFNNYSSVKAHELFTAPEIEKKMNTSIDIIIGGIGTGATLRGIYEYYKKINKKVEIIGVLPLRFPHKIQGIGAGFDPPFIEKDVLNRIIYVNDEEAFAEHLIIQKTDKLHVGLSSGAVLAAFQKLIKEKKYINKNIVLIFADGSDRYEK